MNKRIFVIPVLLISQIFCKKVSAQKVDASKGDFVVSNMGDTLYGKFKKKLFDAATFIVNGEKIELDPTQYSAYYTKHTLFRSIQLSTGTNPQWMECLENGSICLYQFIMQQNIRPGQLPMTRVIWLAQKKNGPVLNVNGIMATVDVAKNNVAALLADKPDIQKEFTENPFTLKSVRYHIQQYNLH